MLSFLKSASQLFLQSACPLCDRAAQERVCRSCQQRLTQEQRLNRTELWTSSKIFAWGVYGGNLKRAIVAFKFNDRPDLAALFGEWLAKAWLEARPIPTKVAIVPIPLHAEKQRQRGFNQAELLAREFCKRSNNILQVNGLQRIRNTEALFSLSAAERDRTLDAAFELGKDFQRQKPTLPVLLLDDIHTSGATLRSATQTLNQQGISVHGIIVLAKTMRH